MGKKSRRRPNTAPKSVSQKEQMEEESNDDESKKLLDENEDESTNNNAPSARPPSIHELDDLKAAVKWMSKGRVDTKGFAKYLPHTAQAIQEGKVTPEEVTRDLEGVYCVTTCRLAGHEMSAMMGVAHLSAMSAFPDKFFQSESQRDDILVAFSKDLESRLERSKAELTEENVPLILKERVDEICEKWAPRLDRELFRGRKGTFLKKCPLYGITSEEYFHEDMPLRRFLDGVDDVYEKEKKLVAEMRMESILVAAKNVAIGFHDISRRCWECKTVCQDLKNCAKCAAAQYCSKGCQRSAWSEGHKHKCELLGCKHAALEDSLKAMDEYHRSSGNDNNFVKNGFSLCDEIDFRALEFSFRHGLPIRKASEIEWGIPSMRLYYGHLERIALGEIWFYPNASEARYLEARLDSETEGDYFMILCAALCFDYDLVTKTGFIQKVCDHTAGGVQMPASIFTDIYFRRGRKAQDAADRFRLRREYKRKILQFFIESLHT